MTSGLKARVFMSGRSQHVTIPAAYRFRSSEVFIRRDPDTGDIILSEEPGSWADIFAALDAALIPDDFLSGTERHTDPPANRPALDELFNERQQ